MALEDDILTTLSGKPGLKGREIASQLGLDKGLVNSALYKLRLRKLAWQDGGYRWFQKNASTESRQPVQPQLDTPLTKLSRYYLHCLSLDDESGVSLFAQSRFSPEYIELPVLPEFDPEERSITSFAGVTELFQRLRTSASRQVPYLGYPVRLRAHRSEKGWEGFFVEPVFLFDFTDEALQRGADPALTQTDRKNLGDFNAVLKLLVQSDGQGQRAGRDVFARYYRLFPHLATQLPCWAVTSLSARGRIPLEPGFFDLLVVDEASQCDIASLLPLLFRAKAAVIIGDPMQLRHISTISPRRDRDLLQQHNLAETHINWAFSENSVFDLASPLASADDIIMLRDHHRSHADIIGFSNEHFYEGRLRVATNYDRLRRPALDAPAIRWIQVEGTVTKPGSGALNEAEAKSVVLELERMLVRQSYQGSVGVVTPFRAQANKIRDLLHAHPQANLMLKNGELLVDTVHRFQGDERDVMFFHQSFRGRCRKVLQSF